MDILGTNTSMGLVIALTMIHTTMHGDAEVRFAPQKALRGLYALGAAARPARMLIQRLKPIEWLAHDQPAASQRSDQLQLQDSVREAGTRVR